ncbi:hypothetical protein V8G54_017568 [Vigna mungo]|uniref:Retrovirus-related Pol polyprotein from transposon TNT 1-94 n=1 Tax=Vigna mungo TaxID=3915 RepID=A0AAQ3S1G3_VIGMU
MVVALETKNKEKFIDAHTVHDSFDQVIGDDQILACHQGDLLVSEYYTKLKILWKELELYRCVLSCNCLTPCACGLLAKLQKEREDDYVIRFLRGLNKSYAQHEREFIGPNPKHLVSDSLAFTVVSNAQPRFNSSNKVPFNASKNTFKNNKFCEKCKKTNHTIETCYFRIGFPVGYKKNKPNTKASASLVEVDSAASLQQLDLDGSPPNDQFTFSKDQYQAILALLQHSKDHSSSVNQASIKHSGTSSASIPLIFDSGATDHICPTKSFFHNLHAITPTHIKLPNHTIVTTNFSGNIHIGDLFILDVLFVPDFSASFISIPKLVSTIDCMAVFCDSHCLLFHKSHFKMIGAARKINGLYCLEESNAMRCNLPFQNDVINKSNVFAVNAVNTSAFWHHRLGHTSNSILQLLSSQHADIIYKNCAPCDTCHFAKHKKLPFSLSTSKSSQFFELLHADIWGPLNTISIDGHKYFLTLVDDFSRFTWAFFMKHHALNHPQQNGIVECKHQHILNVARALLFQSHLPSVFWSFAIRHVFHLINRLPTPFLKNQSPYEIVFSKTPDFNTLRVFDCLAFANTITSGRTKLDKRASKCIFLGFKSGVKGFLLYDMTTQQLLLSRNVIFYESHFPYFVSHHHHIGTAASQQSFDSLIAFDIPGSHFNDFRITSDIVSSNNDHNVVEPIMQFHNDSNDIVQPVDPPGRISTRIRKPPAYLSDYDCSTISFAPTSSSTAYPLQSYFSYSKCSNSHTVFCMSLSAIIEPSSFKEQQAMLGEIKALERNRTWSLVRLPPKKRVVGCKWVIERYKARLVAKGFTQTKGIDFFDTFSPIVKLTTIRFLLSIVVSHNWFLHQLDVDNAFLHGDLDEEVYMKPPPGLILLEPHLVCKLHNSLYGLRQASRQWNAKLTTALLSCGFSQSPTNHSLFLRHSATSFTALLIYVDDIVLTGDSMDDIVAVMKFLHREFQIKDLGNLKYFLGFEVARSRQAEFGLTGSKPTHSPSNPTDNLKDDDGDLLPDPTSYRRLIGKL